MGLRCAERAEVERHTLARLEQVRKDWYAPNNMTLIVVGDLDRLLPAYLERAFGELEPVEPSPHEALPQIRYKAVTKRNLIHGLVGNSAKLHWLFPEPVLDEQHDETFDLLKDYLDWALYRQLRLASGLSYGPWTEREVFGGVGFFSLNADLSREDLPEAEQALEELRKRLLKDGLDPADFVRIKRAAIAHQSWAVQGNSALADYYWGALGDYEDGRFANPALHLQEVSLEQANVALRELLKDPGYLRIEKPLLSDDELVWGGWAVCWGCCCLGWWCGRCAGGPGRTKSDFVAAHICGEGICLLCGSKACPRWTRRGLSETEAPVSRASFAPTANPTCHKSTRHIDVLTILCQGYFLRLTVKPPNAKPDSLHPAHP
nr:hypothetical protein GCM10020185_32110 [Pseudomonas brassicacearum subsp. brassicacearum]